MSVPLQRKDNGKMISVELIGNYKHTVNDIPTFYIGRELDIFLDNVIKNMFPIILSISSIIVGLFFVSWAALHLINTSIDKELIYLGTIALFTGLWKLSDLSTTAMIFSGVIPMSFVPITSLSLIGVPFVLFMKNVFTKPNKYLYYGICVLCFIYCITALALEILNIADFRETLFVNHIILIMIVVLGIFDIIREIKNYGLNKKMKMTIFCLFSCFLGLVLEVIIYYLEEGRVMFSIVLLEIFVYVLILGFECLKRNQTLIAQGKKAKKYYQLAYTDELTGLKSRQAYQEIINAEDFEPKGAVYLMFDLNNLKLCNDNFGHEAGDDYIKEGAGLVRKVFEPHGNCFRIGGDEFCCIIHSLSYNKCVELVNSFKKTQKQFNEINNKKYKMHVAVGIAEYNEKTDTDFTDTIRRADKYMYEDKAESKRG